MDQDKIGLMRRERLETGSHAVLSPRATGDGREQSPRKGAARFCVERRVVGVDHHQDTVDARMFGKRADRARQHRLVADSAILLRLPSLICRAGTASGRYNQARDSHCGCSRKLWKI